MKVLTAIAILFCTLICPLVSHAQQVLIPNPSDIPAGVTAGAFSVSSKNLSIGNVQVGSTKTDTLIVTNTGRTTLTVSTVTSSNTEFTVRPTSASIRSGALKDFAITFAPKTAGTQNGFIVFKHNGPTSPDTVKVSGTGLSPIFSVDPKNIQFGNVPVGNSRRDSVVVTNVGTAALTITNVSSGNALFALSPTNATLMPAQTQTFFITFTPANTAPQSGIIVFTHTASTSRDTVNVSGTGTVAGFVVAPKIVPFGSVLVGSNSRDSVVVTNPGTDALTIKNVISSNGTFSVSPTNGSIAAASSATFYITFAPVTTSVQTGKVVFTHTGSSSPDTVTVSGTGIAAAFAVDRKIVLFGNVPVGGIERDSVVVTNPGTASLAINNVTSNNSAFAVSPTGGLLVPASSATFHITFTPVSAGIQTGKVVFTHTGTSSPDTVTVSGTGIVAAFAVDRKNILFGNVPVGGIGRDSVVVTNSGTASLVINNVTSNNGTFAVSPTGGSIAPSSSAAFHITFTPANATTQTGKLVFTHTASSSPDTVTVSGTGTVAGCSIDRKSIQFGNVPVGSNSSDSVKVTNTGTTALTVSSVSSSNGNFSVTPTNGLIAAASSATFHITFTPVSIGIQTAKVVFTHTASSSPDTLTVSGTGTVAGFSVDRQSIQFGPVPVGSVSSDSVRVTNTGAAALTISNVSSSNGTFVVSPTHTTIAAAATATFHITFTPANANAQSGTIIFTHSAANSPDTVMVSGTGTTAGFSVNWRSFSFGNVPLGANGTDSVIVTNGGTSSLVISSIISTNPRYVVNPGNGTIQPGGKSTFLITFSPTTSGPQSTNVIFTHTASSSPDTLTVTGTGTIAGFAVNRRVIPFGNVQVGTNSRDSVVVTNSGTTTLMINNVTSSNGTFSITPTRASVAAGSTATFHITFTPASAAAQRGNIVFTHTGVTSPDTVVVSGTGTVDGFSLNRSTVQFGSIMVGSSREDSVVVTNNGTTTLSISNVTSNNGAFVVNPTNVTLPSAHAWTFYITCTPTNTTPQRGDIVFTHGGSQSLDTVIVSGMGTMAGFSLNRNTVSFGNVPVGGSALDSIVATNAGSVTVTISGVTSNNSVFLVNPANGTVPPGKERTFFITFTPSNMTPQSGNVVFVHDASSVPDTVSVSGTGSAPLPAPVLLAPANGSSSQALPVSLTWNSVTGATGYWLEMATDPSFTTVLLSDPTLDSTGRQVSGLPQNTKYYWRVSTRNGAGSGPFSPAWTIITNPSGLVSGTISFSGDLSSTSYRMFGLPGVGIRRVRDILSGTQSTDWRILRDNGKDTTYPAYFEDLNADSILQPGEGYWLLDTKDLVISRTDTLPPLATDGTYGIPLHSGWNMISDPFNESVRRTAVIAANSLTAGTLFWEHIGTTTTSSGLTFDPFKGYYFDNSTTNLTTLKIPYPFGTTVAKIADAPQMDWRVELVFDSDINTDRDNYIGIAPNALPGRNELDQHEPPLVFDEGALYFVRPEWDTKHTRFVTDIRAALGTGQTWDFEVWNPRRGSGKISILGLEMIPAENQVVLVNSQNTSPIDMRRANVYTYQTSTTTTDFKLIVGSKEYVDSESAKLIPRAYSLAQNYPNPFNPSTTISWSLPSKAFVSLTIYDVVGREVAKLVSNELPAGVYSRIWNATGMPTGVYFCRLQAGAFTQTKKLLLLK